MAKDAELDRKSATPVPEDIFYSNACLYDIASRLLSLSLSYLFSSLLFSLSPLSLPPPSSLTIYTEEITTFAGSFRGSDDGKGEKAQFAYPCALCFNPRDKCLYLCDSENAAIRKITLKGTEGRGRGRGGGRGGGEEEEEREEERMWYRLYLHLYLSMIVGEVSTFVSRGLSTPVGIAVHHKTNTFYVTDSTTHTVHKITESGSILFLFFSFLFPLFSCLISSFVTSFLICSRPDKYICWKWWEGVHGWARNTRAFRYPIRYSHRSIQWPHFRCWRPNNSKDHISRYNHTHKNKTDTES